MNGHKPGDVIALTDLGACPCGQSVGANFDEGAVSHGEPQCADFSRLGALEYLTWLRAMRGCTCSGDAHESKCPLCK